MFSLMMGPMGLVAILAGWITTEVGRQPWIVYGVFRTRDAVSNHSVTALTTSLVLFVVMYFFVFGTGIAFMLKLVGKGPQRFGEPDDSKHPGQTPRPARPLSATPDKI